MQTTFPANIFAATGFALLPKLISLAECRDTSLQIDAIAALPSEPLMSRTGNELFPLRWDSNLVTPVLQSVDRLNRIRAACGATDLRFISAYVSLKRPNSRALGWHQDWWCWNHPISRSVLAPQIAVICYLQDVTNDGGALRVLPGSHLTRADLHDVIPEAHSAEARNMAEDHPAMLATPHELPLEVRAGDAVVVDYRLLHGTHPNRSDRRRDAVLMSFVPNWAELPTDIQEHLALHPAIPSKAELGHCESPHLRQLFPAFEGAGRSLELNRVPSFA